MAIVAGRARAAAVGDEGEESGRKVGAAVRRRWILERLAESEQVTVKGLAEEFGLTEMSLRRDLNVLAEQGQLVRVRGGARRTQTVSATRQYTAAEQRNAPVKARIARFTAGLLVDRASAFFYSGSTVARVASALGEEHRKELTVVTSSLPVINEVGSWDDPHLVAVGGLFLPSYMTFVGPQAVSSLTALSADVAVVGCDGMSAADGLTTPHQLVAEVGSVMIGRARRTIVVADSTKVGRRGFTPIAPTSAIDVVVTDDGADPAELDALRSLGVEVHVV